MISVNSAPVNNILIKAVGNPAITINMAFLKTCPYKILFSVLPLDLAVRTYWRLIWSRKEFLVNIGKASPEIGSKISANSGAFLQATADNFKATEAITKQYYIISKDPSIIQAAGFSGNGALKKYMTAWVKSQFPKFKSWPKLAKVFQLGIASGTGGTKGDSQSFAEVEARRAEQDRFKAKKVAKEKEGSIKSRKNQKEKEEKEFDSMRVR